MRRKHTKPSLRLQYALLEMWDYRCAYCREPLVLDTGLQIEDILDLTDEDFRWLKHNLLEWDHFIPYAHDLRSVEDNWLPSCRWCNRHKSGKVFESVEEARAYLLGSQDT